MPIIYPCLLRPTDTSSLLLDGQLTVVPKVELLLRQWTGSPIGDSFGGKPLLDVAGQPLFAELAVYELLRLSGWEARWLETYGAPALRPHHYTTWLPGVPRAAQPQQPIEDVAVADLLQRIATANNNSFAGCWDVLGWHGTTVIFAELKRRGKDRLQATQPRWLAAGLQAGLQPANFLLVEWDFASCASPRSL